MPANNPENKAYGAPRQDTTKNRRHKRSAALHYLTNTHCMFLTLKVPLHACKCTGLRRLLRPQRPVKSLLTSYSFPFSNRLLLSFCLFLFDDAKVRCFPQTTPASATVSTEKRQFFDACQQNPESFDLYQNYFVPLQQTLPIATKASMNP